MNPRRATLTVGIAAGGLLVAAVLPMAVAFADDYTDVPDPLDDTITYVSDPDSTETVTSTGGIPPLFDYVSGTQLFYAEDTTAGTPAGIFEVDETSLTTPFGFSNELLLVTDDIAIHCGVFSCEDLPPDAPPPVGSVFDVTNFGNGFENVYSDVVGTGGAADTITDTLMTPFGDFSIPIPFDMAALF